MLNESPTRNDLPELLTVKQAAKLANVCDRTIYRMVDSGEIKAVRIRNALRINRDALLSQFGL